MNPKQDLKLKKNKSTVAYMIVKQQNVQEKDEQRTLGALGGACISAPPGPGHSLRTLLQGSSTLSAREREAEARLTPRESVY